MIETIGFTRNTNTKVSTIETSINKITVFPIVLDAFCLLFAPTACPMETVTPIARPTIMTVSMCIT